MSYEKEKIVAIDAAVSAAGVCRWIRRETEVGAIRKGDGTPVTVADFASQAVFCRLIKTAFPLDPIVAEETAGTLQQSKGHLLGSITSYVGRVFDDATPDRVLDWIDQGQGGPGPRYWTLDPIDGTKGFLRGDHFALAVALIVQGKVVLGVLACPSLGTTVDEAGNGVLFGAIRGEGAFMTPLSHLRPVSIHVCEPNDRHCNRIAESFESAHSDRRRQGEVAGAAGISGSPILMDGQAKYGVVARGDAALYLRLPYPGSSYKEKIWDHAAGSIILEEAGGIVTDMHGLPLDFSRGEKMETNSGIVAGNPLMHKRAVRIIREKGL